MTTRILLTLVLEAVCTVQVRAGFEEGIGAYERGDYTTTVKEWRPPAINAAFARVDYLHG